MSPVTPPYPYWQCQLMSPFSKGETGLDSLATPVPLSPRPMSPYGSADAKLSEYQVLPGPLIPGWRWVGSGPRHKHRACMAPSADSVEELLLHLSPAWLAPGCNPSAVVSLATTRGGRGARSGVLIAPPLAMLPSSVDLSRS